MVDEQRVYLAIGVERWNGVGRPATSRGSKASSREGRNGSFMSTEGRGKNWCECDSLRESLRRKRGEEEEEEESVVTYDDGSVEEEKREERENVPNVNGGRRKKCGEMVNVLFIQVGTPQHSLASFVNAMQDRTVGFRSNPVA